MRFRIPARPFAPQGPSGRFPCLVATTGALRLPAPPPRSLALARRFRLVTEKTGPPKFLGDPRHACSGLRPRRNLGSWPPGTSPLRCAPSAWPSGPSDPSAPATHPISGSDSAAHMLAVYASRPRLPVCLLTAAQDSLPAGGLPFAGRESNPLGHCSRFPLMSGSTWASSLSRLLGARKAEMGLNERHWPGWCPRDRRYPLPLSERHWG